MSINKLSRFLEAFCKLSYSLSSLSSKPNDPLLPLILLMVACRPDMALLALSSVCFRFEFATSLLTLSKFAVISVRFPELFFKLDDTVSVFANISLICVV